MTVQLAEIDTQDASTLVCDYLICGACGIVDRDHSRMRKGSKCSTCGKESEAGRLAFPISVHILVDLVQQAYHSKAPVGPISGPQVPSIGTILLFCTLREALLNGFLINRLRAQRVPTPLIEKLLADNRLASQKFGDLFTSVVGCKWDNAVTEASRHAAIDFAPISNLMRDAAAIRNEFLHEGRAWQATHQIATIVSMQCHRGALCRLAQCLCSSVAKRPLTARRTRTRAEALCLAKVRGRAPVAGDVRPPCNAAIMMV